MSFYKKILVAFDGSSNSKEALKRAKQIVQQMDGSSLHIVTVWGKPMLQGSAGYGYVNYEKLVKAVKKEAQSILERAKVMTKDIGEIKNGVVLEGYPSQEILNYAHHNGIDLILIGHRGLGGLNKLFLGSVSQQVVQGATCAVLVVK